MRTAPSWLTRGVTAGALLAGAAVPLAVTAAPAQAGPMTLRSLSASASTTAGAIRINSGGAALSEAGVSWQADRSAVGGQSAVVARPVAGTDQDQAQQSVRWGMTGYAIPVSAVGTYQVTLKFAEMAFAAPQRRVFSVQAEGASFTRDLDVFAAVGRDREHAVTRDVLVEDGVLDLGFSATRDNAMVGSIEVALKQSGTPVDLGSQFHCMWSGASGYGSPAFDATRGAVLDKLKAAGVRKVRIDVGWDGLQPTGNTAPNPEGWYAKLLDGCVNGAKTRGMDVLLTLHMSPTWARPAAYASTPWVLPADPRAIQTVSGWLSSRYAGKVEAIEVWNEPNLRHFVQVVDPVKYVAVLGAAHAAIKAANPAMQVVFSGADRVAVSPGAPAVDDFYSLAYRAGAKGKFDVMGVHTYQGPADAPPGAPDVGTWRITHMPALIALMAANGDSTLPISVTEFGWSVHANALGTATWDLGVTEQQQADYTVGAMDLLGTWPQVKSAYVYAERQKATGNLHQDGYGMLRRDLSPRPVLTALAARAARLQSTLVGIDKAVLRTPA